MPDKIIFTRLACVISLAASLLITIPLIALADGPIFVEQPRAKNPLPPPAPLPNPISDTIQFSAPAFVDIDADGDLDIFIGEELGTIQFYLNENGRFNPMTGVDNPFDGVDVGNRSAPTFVNIDGDDDFDAFIGEASGTIRYFENESGMFTPMTATNPLSQMAFGGSVHPTFANIVGDTNLDVIIGVPNGTLHVFRNNGNGTFTEQIGVDNPFNGIDVEDDSAPTFADLNTDGLLDLIIGEQQGHLSVFLNTGGVFNPLNGLDNPFNGIDVGGNSTPALVDIDGDGKLDVIVGEEDGNLNLLRNSGNNVFGLVADLSNPFAGIDVGNVASPTFVDFDADGDADLFVGEFTGAINYYENIGTGTFMPVTGLNNPLAGISGITSSNVALANFTGGAAIDAIIGSADGTLRAYQNNGTRPLSELTHANNPFDSIDLVADSAPAWGDINSDGNIDLLAGNNWGFLHYIRNNGDGTFTEQVGDDNPFHTLDFGSLTTPTLADLDADGDLDIIVGEFDGVVLYFTYLVNNGDETFSQQAGADNPFEGINLGKAKRTKPAFADLDGDGDLDLFIGEEDGTIHYYRNESLPDLAIHKTVLPKTTALGRPLVFTLSYSNAGFGGALDVTITDPLSDYFSNANVTSSAPISQVGSANFAWQIGNLAPGEGGTITISGIVSTTVSPGLFTVTATISSTSIETETINNTSSVAVTIIEINQTLYLPLVLK